MVDPKVALWVASLVASSVASKDYHLVVLWAGLMAGLLDSLRVAY